jgi:hypothetical protein
MQDGHIPRKVGRRARRQHHGNQRKRRRHREQCASQPSRLQPRQPGPNAPHREHAVVQQVRRIFRVRDMDRSLIRSNGR